MSHGPGVHGPSRWGASRHGPDCECVRCRGFEPGNALHLSHGANVSKLQLSRQKRVTELADLIRDTQPVGAACDEGAVWRLALVYRRIELASEALDEADGAVAEKPLAAYGGKGADFLANLRADLSRWLSQAARIEADLGRTPASRARLGVDIANARRALTVVQLHEAAELEDVIEGEAS